MKHSLLYALLFTLVFAGCKKDKNTNGITGKWNIDKTEMITLKNGVKDDENIVPYVSGSYVEFKSDGSFFLYAKEVGESEFEEGQGSYTFSNNTVILVIDGNAQSFEVQEFKKNVLILSASGKHIDDDDEYHTTVSLYLSR